MYTRVSRISQIHILVVSSSTERVSDNIKVYYDLWFSQSLHTDRKYLNSRCPGSLLPTLLVRDIARSSLVSSELWRHCGLSGGTQYRALPRYQSEKMKIWNILFPVVFTVIHLSCLPLFLLYFEVLLKIHTYILHTCFILG